MARRTSGGPCALFHVLAGEGEADGGPAVRLALQGEVGFVVDESVTVISEMAGNLILQVKDSRVAVDRTMANRIMI